MVSNWAHGLGVWQDQRATQDIVFSIWAIAFPPRTAADSEQALSSMPTQPQHQVSDLCRERSTLELLQFS